LASIEIALDANETAPNIACNEILAQSGASFKREANMAFDAFEATPTDPGWGT
jgi:hypothetical protein